ncbi:MAG TPA: hypothetical protein VN442_02085 [Bryobacteraceae bacterium]|nr:hypothetical protein [Bryobacteraceae bacterium]
MNFGLWALLLPLIEVATALWLVHRVCWQRYPALLLYLAGDAAAITLGVLVAPNWVTGWFTGQPVRMGLRTLLCFEILWFGCVRLDRRGKLRATAAIACSSLIAGAATAWFVGLSPWRSLLVFRQYFHLELAAALLGLHLHLMRNPIAENEEHRAYRLIGTLILVRIALSGMFVPGGFGYLVWPFTRITWAVVDVLSWTTAAVLTILLAWRMTCSFSSQRPQRVFARQQANRAN